MSRYKRVTITWLATVLSILFIGSTALCKPPDDKPGKPEPRLIIKEGGNEITEVTLTVHDRRLFEAEIVDAGSMDTSGIVIEWRVLGSIGDIDSTGQFTATKVGRGMVGASAKVDKKPLTAYVVVKVSEGEPPPGEGKRIVVTVEPDFVDLPPGDTQSFEVVEPEVELDDSVQWRAIPPRIGYIEQDGNKCRFTAGANTGKGIIIATVQTQDGKGTGRATVVVVDGNLPLPGQKLKLNITPKHARVDNGGSVEFEAKVTGPKDYYVPIWERNPSESGDIDGEGERVIFNAASTEEEFKGRALVIARIQTETEFAMDWATVDIGGPGKFPSKVKISVEPEEWSMVVGGEKLFIANGVPTEQIAQLTWSVAPTRIGTINGGHFTAIAPGWGLIIAKLDTEQGTAVGKAKVYVGATEESLPFAISIVAIEPTTAATTVNGEPVTFQVIYTQGSPGADTPIQWKAVPSSLGAISSTGPLTAEFTPGSKAGYVLITAKVVGPRGSATAQARVTISVGSLEVEITGDSETVVNGTYTYTAFVKDSENKLVNPDELEFKWRLAPPSIGKLTGDSNTATFTPRKAGRCVIVVDVQGPQGTGTGRISITVNE